MSRTAGAMHIGRIEDDTVNFAILIWKITAVNTILKVGCFQLVFAAGNQPPKSPLSISNVRYNARWLYIQLENLRKDSVISFHGSAKYEIVRRVSVFNRPLLFIYGIREDDSLERII